MAGRLHLTNLSIDLIVCRLLSLFILIFIDDWSEAERYAAAGELAADKDHLNGSKTDYHSCIIFICWTTRIPLTVALVVHWSVVQGTSSTERITEAILESHSDNGNLTEATGDAVKDCSNATDIEKARAKDEEKVKESIKEHYGAVDSPYTGPVSSSLEAC